MKPILALLTLCGISVVSCAKTTPAPTINLTANPSSVTSVGSVTLSATATNADRVEFYRNGALVFTDHSAPFGWSDMFESKAQNGSYQYSAKATGAGGTAASAAVVVTADIPAASIVLGASPSSVALGSASTLTAQVSNVLVASVDFLLNGKVVRTDTSPPYSIKVAPMASASYTARANTTKGVAAQSSTTAVTVDSAATPACATAIVPTPGVQTLRVKSSTCAGFGYAEYVPADYASKSAWPLIIFFNGNGEVGNGESELGNLVRTGLPAEIASNTWDPARRFVVISPQTTEMERGSWHVNRAIAFAKANYNIDPKRIYLTGLSGGTVAVYNYLYDNAGGEVAAAVPIAGWSDFADIDTDGAECNFAHIPTWFFHGNADNAVPYQHSQTTNQRLNACKPTPSPASLLTLYSDTSPAHDVWSRTYSLKGMNTANYPVVKGYTSYTQSIYDWMLQYSR